MLFSKTSVMALGGNGSAMEAGLVLPCGRFASGPFGSEISRLRKMTDPPATAAN